MAIITEEDKTIYESFDTKSRITYKLETSKGCCCILKKLILSCEDESLTIDLKGELSSRTKNLLKNAYMNLEKEEFVDLFTRLNHEELCRITTGTMAYVGGERNEDYTAYVDDYGNIIAICNYVYHYNHGSSSLYVAPAGKCTFKNELRSFANYLIHDLDKYQKFIQSLNKDSLKKYFEISYIPKSKNDEWGDALCASLFHWQ